MNTLLAGFSTASAVSLLVGAVLPIIVGFVTKVSMNKGLKATLLATLSAVTSVLSQWVDSAHAHTAFHWQLVVQGAFVTWAVAELTYFKVWKPSGVAAAVQNKGVIDPPPDLSYGTSLDNPPVTATDPASTVDVPIIPPNAATS